MHSITRTFRLPSTLLLIALVSIIAVQAIAQRSSNSSAPTVVVSVNLPDVMAGLKEASAEEARLSEMAQQIAAEDEQRQESLKAMEAAMGEIPKTAAARLRQSEEELALAALEYRAWRQFAFEQVDIEKAIVWQQLDKSIREAVAELCQTQGYELVLVNDAPRELMINAEARVSREEQVKQQITNRRLLYAASSVDITTEVIQRMNNAFDAGR